MGVRAARIRKIVKRTIIYIPSFYAQVRSYGSSILLFHSVTTISTIINILYFLGLHTGPAPKPSHVGPTHWPSALAQCAQAPQTRALTILKPKGAVSLIEIPPPLHYV